VFCQYFQIFVRADPYEAIYVSHSQRYLWCLQNSILCILLSQSLKSEYNSILIHTGRYASVCITILNHRHSPTDVVRNSWLYHPMQSSTQWYRNRPYISEKHFRPGGMAPSEWTGSVRAVRDTPVADYSTPGVNATRVALHIALRSLFRWFFSLCRSPNLNKHSGVVANCDHTSECVHRVHASIGIAMQCDAAKISPGVPSTLSSRSVGRWEDMILPGREDLRNCVDLRNLGKNERDQKIGKIECVFSLYDKMRWKWDAVYLARGLPNIYSASLIPPPLPLYLRTPTVAS
jgi:hypothetical protein